MIRKTHRIRRINVAIALAATVAASLVLIVPSASAGVRPDDRSSPRGQGASSPAELSLDQATTDAVRSTTRGSVRPNDRVDLRTAPGVDGAAATTRSAGDEPFDARNVFGLALFLAVFGLGTAAMIKNYAAEKSMGWGSIGGGGRWG